MNLDIDISNKSENIVEDASVVDELVDGEVSFNRENKLLHCLSVLRYKLLSTISSLNRLMWVFFEYVRNWVHLDELIQCCRGDEADVGHSSNAVGVHASRARSR